jgi:hypothetical protein
VTFSTFYVYRDDDRTRIDVDGDLLGWGVQFPSGACYVEWNRDAFPDDDRLEHPHVSRYGSVDDVEQGTGGRVVVANETGEVPPTNEEKEKLDGKIRLAFIDDDGELTPVNAI